MMRYYGVIFQRKSGRGGTPSTIAVMSNERPAPEKVSALLKQIIAELFELWVALRPKSPSASSAKSEAWMEVRLGRKLPPGQTKRRKTFNRYSLGL
jgi:hypothetical protein